MASTSALCHLPSRKWCQIGSILNLRSVSVSLSVTQIDNLPAYINTSAPSLASTRLSSPFRRLSSTNSPRALCAKHPKVLPSLATRNRSLVNRSSRPFHTTTIHRFSKSHTMSDINVHNLARYDPPLSPSSTSFILIQTNSANSMPDFKKALTDAADSLVILDCFATWCGPCKVIAPKVVGFAKDFPQARFYKIDVDEVPDVAQELGIRAMPTFVLFKNGEKIDEVVGANEKALKAAIEKNL